MQAGRSGSFRFAVMLGILVASVLLGCQGESTPTSGNAEAQEVDGETIWSSLQEQLASYRSAADRQTQPLELATTPRQPRSQSLVWKDLAAGPEALLVVEETVAVGSRMVFTDPRAPSAVANDLMSQLSPKGWRLLEILEGPAETEGSPPGSYFFWFWRPNLSFQPQHLYEAGCAHIQTIPAQAGASVHLGSACHMARNAAMVQGSRHRRASAQQARTVQGGGLTTSVGQEWSVATPFDATVGCTTREGFVCLARQDLLHERDGSEVSLQLVEHQSASAVLELSMPTAAAVSRRLHPRGIPLVAREVETVNGLAGYHVYLVKPVNTDETEALVSDLHFASEQRHLVFSGTLTGDSASLAAHGTMLTETTLAAEPVPVVRE